MVAAVWTVGHSAHEPGDFVDLLERHDITAVADVRAEPYSRHVPHFCKEPLTDLIRARRIGYVFLGRELGARSEDESVFTGAQIDFGKLAATEAFAHGLERVRTGAIQHRIALLCAEHDPLHCHRAILVSRHLRAAGLDVQHIGRDGGVESHTALEQRLLAHLGMDGGDLFTPRETQLADAYEQQGRLLAWRRP